METVVLVYPYCKSRVRNSGLLFLQKKEAVESGHMLPLHDGKTPPSPKWISAFKRVLLGKKKNTIGTQMPIEDILCFYGHALSLTGHECCG